MSRARACHHDPGELRFLDADERTNVVTFTAPSKSRPGQVNTVSLDVLAWAVCCDCEAAQHGRPCWHVAHVAAAFDRHPARQLARSYSDQQLATAGRKVARMCRVYRARCWSTVPADRVGLVAARLEHADRHAVTTKVAAVTVAA